MWLIVSIGAYLFTAFANIGDKLVVSSYSARPSVYAFYVGMLQLLVLVLIPFGVELPASRYDLALLMIELFAGIAFLAGLASLYAALQEGETSRVIPIIGATSPLATLGLASFFLGERLGAAELGAFFLLLAGIVVITYDRKTRHAKNFRYAEYAVAAGFLFAVAYTSAKYIFTADTWVNGFFWMRVGSIVAALALLCARHVRRAVSADLRSPQAKKGGVILATQSAGAVGFVLLNYAISIGSVTLVTALQAMQYLFVFIGVAVAGRWLPALRERSTTAIVARKLAAAAIISVGLMLLAGR